MPKACPECKKTLSVSNFRKTWLKDKNRFQTCSYCFKCERNRHKEYKRKQRLLIYKPIKPIKGELWVDIPGFDGIYSASNKQRIKSMERIDDRGHFRNEFIMKLRKSSGYCRVGLYKNGTYYHLGVHVLVCMAFHPNPENKPEVNHKNGKKDCNYPWNLEWATRSENSQHALKFGLIKHIGQNGYFAKLKNEEAIEIYKSELPAQELAKIYNVSYPTIRHIKTGVTWKQITGAPRKKRKII